MHTNTTVRVKFIDVGRDKQSWEATLPRTQAAFVRSIRAHSALLSRDVWVDMDGGNTGEIVVGGFRVVGKVEILNDKL